MYEIFLADLFIYMREHLFESGTKLILYFN